jgi:hypothetical protein
MQTDRLTILMDPMYKASVTKRAAERGVSTSEHVRNALDYFKSDNADAELEALTSELEGALPEMREDCDAIIASMRAMNEKMEAYRAEKRQRKAA